MNSKRNPFTIISDVIAYGIMLLIAVGILFVIFAPAFVYWPTMGAWALALPLVPIGITALLVFGVNGLERFGNWFGSKWSKWERDYDRRSAQ